MKGIMKSKIWLFAPIFTLFIFSGCGHDTLIRANDLTATNSVYADGSTVGVAISATSWCAEVAQSSAAQSKGLSGRTGLSKSSAMLFPFSEPSRYQFWMKDMQFDIDILWIQDSRVVDITHGAKHPESQVDDASLPRYTPKTPVNFVLEVANGEASHVAIGDTVTYTKQCEKIPS